MKTFILIGALSLTLIAAIAFVIICLLERDFRHEEETEVLISRMKKVMANQKPEPDYLAENRSNYTENQLSVMDARDQIISAAMRSGKSAEEILNAIA